MDIPGKRITKRDEVQMIPQQISGEEGLVAVDVTWGIIQPMQAAERVVTVGELDVIEHQENNMQIIDARIHETSGTPTIKGSKNIPHSEIVERMGELDRERPAIFFCNGPQCPQSPTAIRALLGVGYRPEKILYYRGGMHDWITLGLPIEKVKI